MIPITWIIPYLSVKLMSPYWIHSDSRLQYGELAYLAYRGQVNFPQVS